MSPNGLAASNTVVTARQLIRAADLGAGRPLGDDIDWMEVSAAAGTFKVLIDVADLVGFGWATKPNEPRITRNAEDSGMADRTGDRSTTPQLCD